MKDLPEPPQWRKLTEADDDDLHRMLREHRFFSTAILPLISRVKQRTNAIQSEIDKRLVRKAKAAKRGEKAAVIVTDHALIRYLEREKGVDIKALVSEIQDRLEKGETYMNGALTVHEGLVFVRRKGSGEAVATIMPEGFLDEEDEAIAEQAYARDGDA